MKCLFLNLASHQGCIAAVASDETVAIETVDHRLSDEDVPAAIKRVLEKAAWNYDDLTHIACVTGPGGFTSLRVGAATANALRFSLGVPVCGIHLNDLLRAQSKDAKAVWLHSTKKELLFIRKPDQAEAELMTLEQFPSRVSAGDTWIGELIPEHRDKADNMNLKESDVHPVDQILPALLASRHYEDRDVEPWYGRGW